MMTKTDTLDIEVLDGKASEDGPAGLLFHKFLEDSKFQFQVFLQRIFILNHREFGVSKTFEISLPESKSNLVQNPTKSLHAFAFSGLAGAFKKGKGNEGSVIFGRAICDMIKQEYNCNGFFTLDELPRYGFSRKDTREVISLAKNELIDFRPESDLLVMVNYEDKRLVTSIKHNLTIKFRYLLGLD